MSSGGSMNGRHQVPRFHGSASSNTSNFYGPVTYVERSENLFMGANYGSVNQTSYSTRTDPGALLLHEAVPDASHIRDLRTSPPNSTCLPGTRKAVINEIVSWMEDPTFAPAPMNDRMWHPGLRSGNVPAIASSTAPEAPSLAKERHVAWLCGPEGCGKSAIAQSVAEEAERRGYLSASFFFSSGSDARSKFNRVAITLASQLAAAVPATKPHIEAALRASPNLDGISVEAQFERLIFKPLRAAVASGILPAVKRRSPAGWLINYVKPFLIVIDGLDECVDHQDVQDLVQHMIQSFEKGRSPHIPLRILISSRGVDHIRQAMGTNRVAVLDLGNHDSKKDMEVVLRHPFRVAAKRDEVIRSYGEEWPSDEQVKLLAERAGGSFRFVTVVVGYILGLGDGEDDGLESKERLELALTMDHSILAH